MEENNFKSSEYWKNRYNSGGNSGAGSYNNLAIFKSEIINKFIEENNISNAIEFGCGDGNQLKLLNSINYIGLDVSEKAIEMCQNIFKDDDKKTFKKLDLYNNEKADLSLSLDVIFHLVEDDVYQNYMKNLFKSSNKYVIVYSSNDEKKKHSSPHVKHRKFTDWVEKNRKDFTLVKFIPNKYPFDGDGDNTSFADFYIYKKKDTE